MGSMIAKGTVWLYCDLGRENMTYKNDEKRKMATNDYFGSASKGRRTLSYHFLIKKILLYT